MLGSVLEVEVLCFFETSVRNILLSALQVGAC
jgi:hypothetical protein